MTETWKSISGYEGLYEVSDQGRVRSLDRITFHVRGNGVRYRKELKGRILVPGLASNGYPTVNLSKGDVKSRRNYLVHQLVLLAFVGPAPEGKISLHGKNDRTNVSLANLRYGTHSENMEDMIRDNAWDVNYYKSRHRNNREAYEKGRKNIRKFTDEQLLDIRRMLAEGKSNNSIAKIYGVDHGAIRAIKTGRTYTF